MKKILLLAFFALSTTLNLLAQTVTSRKIFANPDCNCVTIVSIADTNAVHDIDARAILSIRRIGTSNVELTTQSGAVFVFNHVNTFTKDSVRIATTSFGLQKAIRAIVKSLKVILAKSNASGYNATFDASGLTANRTYTLPDQDATLGSGGGGGSYVPLTGSSSLSGDFVPTTANTSNLGSSANRFLGVYSSNLYASGKAFVGPITSSAYTGLTVDVGLTSFLGGTTTLNGALLPNVGGLSLGGVSSGQHWGNVFATTINNQVGTLNLQSGGANRVSLLSSRVEISPSLTVFNTGTNTGQLMLGIGNGGILYGNTNLVFQTGVVASEAARIHSDGNFSVGSSTNAGFKFDVNGTARIQGDATFSSAIYIPTGATTIRTTVNSNGFGFDGSNQPFIVSSGNIVTNGNLNSQYSDLYNIGSGNRFRSIGITRQVAVGNYTFTSSSGNDSNILLTANFNTTGTAASNLIYGGAYYQATGSGVQNLINLGEFSAANGGGVFTSKFSVDKTGKTLAASYNLSALNTAPASASDTGTAGEIRVTANYIYVCTATNTWVRSALSTWP